MFSVIFPGQGSQIVGMGKDLYNRYEIVKKLFKEADESLGIQLSKIILEIGISRRLSASRNNFLTKSYLSKNSFPIPTN